MPPFSSYYFLDDEKVHTLYEYRPKGWSKSCKRFPDLENRYEISVYQMTFLNAFVLSIPNNICLYTLLCNI